MLHRIVTHFSEVVLQSNGKNFPIRIFNFRSNTPLRNTISDILDDKSQKQIIRAHDFDSAWLQHNPRKFS
jgi:hypothetical protein